MKAWLIYLSEQTIVVVDFVALLTVIWATMEVCAAILWNGVVHRSNFVLRAIWLRYAQWLVAALSLQLAADIIETSISTNWETIGKGVARRDPHLPQLFHRSRRGRGSRPAV
jgi:uncharacterized membrane protein